MLKHEIINYVHSGLRSGMYMFDKIFTPCHSKDFSNTISYSKTMWSQKSVNIGFCDHIVLTMSQRFIFYDRICLLHCLKINFLCYWGITKSDPSQHTILTCLYPPPGVTLPLFELCVSCWSEGAKVERVGSDRVMWLWHDIDHWKRGWQGDFNDV